LALGKDIYLFALQEQRKIFVLFLRNEETEKGEEESAHEEKSGNTIFLNCLFENSYFFFFTVCTLKIVRTSLNRITEMKVVG